MITTGSDQDFPGKKSLMDAFMVGKDEIYSLYLKVGVQLTRLAPDFVGIAFIDERRDTNTLLLALSRFNMVGTIAHYDFTAAAYPHIKFFFSKQLPASFLARLASSCCQPAFPMVLEKTADACNYSKPNCFQVASFVSIGLNVAAQWLVDGVHFFFYLGTMVRT